MSDRKRGFDKSFFSAGGLVLILLILVFINFIFSKVNVRWDATGDKLYSLSEGTRNIIDRLQEDVVIKVFYNKSVVSIPANIKNYAGRMLDFLDEYEQYSKGKVSVEVYDPKLDSDEEEWAQKYGLEAVDLPTGDRIYFGLVAVAADQQETIKMIDPSGEERLEYDITRIISRVQSADRLKIGIVSGLPVFGQQPNPYTRQPQQPAWQFVAELQKIYDVVPISPAADQIDAGTDLLLMIHPRSLSDRLLFAIDQYILAGGNALVFVDPFSTIDPSPGGVKASSLGKLFAAWGIEMVEGRVLADFNHSTKISSRINQVEDNPFWLSLRPDAFNADDLVTSRLESILLPMAGVIKNTAKDRYRYEALLQSSSNAALEEAYRARLSAQEIRRDFKPAGEIFDLAVKVSGKFASAFPDGKPPADPKEPPAPADGKDAKSASPASTAMTAGVKAATIIVVADSDMLFDGYYVHKQNFLGFNIARIFNDNLNFLLNSAEMLSGSQELIGIRSRGKFEKPFTRVQMLEKKAGAKWLVREQELLKKVDETNKKLAALEQQKDASQKLIISREQEAEIQKFQQEKLRIRKELKIVRRNLRADIESLGVSVKLINIFLMPLLVCLAGILFAVYKRRKRLQA